MKILKPDCRGRLFKKEKERKKKKKQCWVNKKVVKKRKYVCHKTNEGLRMNFQFIYI